MQGLEPSQELEVAQQAAQRAGEIILRYFHEGPKWQTKDVANLFSQADIEAERAIAALIRQRFPSHDILGEELDHGARQSEHLWIVDPLDGTNNFAHRIPHFAVSIAYYRGGEPQLGVIFQPCLQDWYLTQRGAGAWWNGQRLQVAPETKLSEVIIGVGFYYDRGAMMEATLTAIRDLFRQQIHGIRRFGTAALDLCHVARGMYGAYFEYELAPWDFAAGRLLVEEAGGRVTTARGTPLTLERNSILASNGLVHEAVLQWVAAQHP